ncbi:hypothetical protein BH09VER1_BH09VER1_08640 [soil metagenome]
MSDTAPVIRGKTKKLVLALLLLVCVLAAIGYQLFPFAKSWWEMGYGGPLPVVNVDEIVSRFDPTTAAYYRTVEAQTLSAYRRSNWWHLRSYFVGREAVRIFVCQQVGGDLYCEGLLRKAEQYANRAYLRENRDPLISTICDASVYDDHYPNNNKTANEIADRALALAQSSYPPACKLAVMRCAVKSFCVANAEDKTRLKIASAYARFPALCDELVSQYGLLLASGAPANLMAFWAHNIFDTLEPYPEVFKLVGQRIDPAFEKCPYEKATRALCLGDYYICWAWSARGTGWADSVTPLGWQLMRDRLDKAREILTDAWKLNPKSAAIPTMLITVELGQEGDREKMEQYFQAAIANDPGYCRAYSRKMYFLQPRWHGTVRDVFDFGLKCVNTGRWSDLIPLVLPDGVKLVADQQEQVYQEPGVWKVISEVYEEFLKRYPNSCGYRTKYLQAAYAAKQWPTVKAQLAALGDDWDRQALYEDDYAKISREAKSRR